MLKDDTVLVLSPSPLFANGKLSVSELTVSFLTRLSRPLIKQWGALGAVGNVSSRDGDVTRQNGLDRAMRNRAIDVDRLMKTLTN